MQRISDGLRRLLLDIWTGQHSINQGYCLAPGNSIPSEMLPCLQRLLLRSALSPTTGSGLARTARCIHRTPVRSSAAPPPLCALVSAASVQSRNLGTHPLKEPMEPLNSPQSAKEFIYSLHPSERTTLLRELHRFESMAIAQDLLNLGVPRK